MASPYTQPARQGRNLDQYAESIDRNVARAFASIYGQTDAERTANVEPVNPEFLPNDARRMGLDSAGSASSNKSALEKVASVGGEYHIPPGTYEFDPSVTFAKKISLVGAGRATVLKPSGPASSGAILDFTAADSGLERLHIDASQVDDFRVVGLTGTRSYCDISMSGMGAKSGAISGNVAGVVCGTGDRQRVRVDAWDFINSGASNGSFPRVVAINSDAQDVTVDFLRCHDCTAGLVIGNGTVRPKANCLELHNMRDNGIYNLGSVDFHCDSFHYNGDEEGWVERGTRTFVDNLYVLMQDASSSALGFQDATNFMAESVTIVDVSSTDFENPIRTRSGNTLTDGVRIKNLTMFSRAHSPISFRSGAVNNLRIDNWDLEHHYINSSQQKNIVSHDSGDQVRYGTVSVKVIDDTAALTGSDSFAFEIPAGLTALSFIENLLVDVDGGDYDVRLTNTAQDNFAIVGVGQQIDSSQRIIVPTTRPPKILYGNSAPSAGAWLRGDIIIDITPSASGDIGFVCVSSGSPGSWKQFGAIDA